jgi:hypothetical protein
MVDVIVKMDLSFDFYRKNYDPFTISRQIWNSEILHNVYGSFGKRVES